MKLLDFLANIKRKAEFPVPAGEIKIARIQDGKIMHLDGIVIFGGVVLHRLKS